MMSTIVIGRQPPRMWEEITAAIDTSSLFAYFTPVLDDLDISIFDAARFFCYDYATRRTNYVNQMLPDIFNMVYAVNKRKYELLIDAYKAEYDPIENYNSTETSTDTRTPDISTNTTGTNNSTSTVKNNQIKTVTESPDNYVETSARSTTSYNSEAYRPESKTETSATGTRATSEVYNGNPDTSTTDNTIDNTVHTTGSETITHTMQRSGNIGVTSSQQMLEQQLQLAAKMNIFKILASDLASELFLAAW